MLHRDWLAQELPWGLSVMLSPILAHFIFVLIEWGSEYTKKSLCRAATKQLYPFINTLFIAFEI